MRKLILLLLLIPALSGAFDYSKWKEFVELNYRRGVDNTWIFLGKLRGGYLFYISLGLQGDTVQEKVLVKGPDGKLRKHVEVYDDFIFDGSKFYYSSSNFQLKITGYGLSLGIKKPSIKFYGKPVKSFISSGSVIDLGYSTLSFPMWEWKFKGYFIINGMKFKIQWLLPLHFTGKIDGVLASGVTDDYSFTFYNPAHEIYSLVFERNSSFYTFRKGLPGIKSRRDFVFTGKGRSFYLEFETPFDCKEELSEKGYKIVLHPPYQVLPGNGLVICLGEGL